MDWDNVNVALDQDAIRAVQEAGNTSFSIPWWVWAIVVAVAVALAFGAVKKAKESKDESDANDKK